MAGNNRLSVTVPVAVDAAACGETLLTARVFTTQAKPWCEPMYQIGVYQFAVAYGGRAAIEVPAAAAPALPPLRIGLALGGGAAKGFAHIGAIKMLEANGIRADVVAGTSAGSVVGALYASGMDGPRPYWLKRSWSPGGRRSIE